MKKNILIVLGALLLSATSFAQRGGTVTTVTTLPVTTTTVPGQSGNTNNGNTETIQSAGKGSSDKANWGVVVGGVMTGVAATKAVGFWTAYSASCAAAGGCQDPLRTKAMIWTGVALVGVKVTLDMSRTKRQSDNTVCDVNTSASGCGSGGNGTETGYNPTNPNANNPNNPTDQIPGWEVTERQIRDLENQGWNYDPSTGLVTGPNGQRFPASSLNTSGGLAGLGLTPAQIAQFQAEMDAAKKEAEKVASQGTDNGSMFDDGSGGGGSGGGNSLAANSAGAGGQGRGNGMGISRDPSQVAGMSVNYNGEPIGVAADGLFELTRRRYDHHERNGTLIVPTGP